jgi:enoyl-CoA hydratase/carnithine racemase
MVAIQRHPISLTNLDKWRKNMSEFKTFRFEVSGNVARVTFSNPPINLIDDAMNADLSNLVRMLEVDQDLDVVIFRSDNPEYFLAHFDIAPGPHRVIPSLGAASMKSHLHTRISNLRQVTIGEIRGRARGAGNELLLALDMRFASREKAVFGQPESILGLAPGAGGNIRLAQLVGRSRALEACLSGDDYDAETAERYGWINRALADSELSDFVDRLAQRIASFPRSGLTTVKSIINRVTAPDSATLIEESHRFVADLKNPEVRERLTWMLQHGGQTDGDLERHLGRLLTKYPEQLQPQ